MQPHNRKKLSDRVIKAAEAALTARKYVSPIDVLVGIGWLDPGAVNRGEWAISNGPCRPTCRAFPRP